MSDFLYYCSDCNYLVADPFDEEDIPCEKCSAMMIPLHINEDVWNAMPKEEKKSLIRKIRAPKPQRRMIQMDDLGDFDDDFDDVEGNQSDYQQLRQPQQSQPQQRPKQNLSQQRRTVQNHQQQSSHQKKTQGCYGRISAMSIVALIFSILGCTGLLGIVLGIMDLTRTDGRKKGLSIAAIIVGILMTIVAFSVIRIDSDKNGVSEDSNIVSESVNEETPAPTLTPTPTPLPEENNNASTDTANQPIVIPDITDLEYMRIDDARADEFYKAQVIDNQGENYKSKTVMTYGRIYNDAAELGYLQISVPGTVHGIDCYLAKDSVCALNDLNKNDTAIVVGTIAGVTDALFFEQVKMVDCYIIGVVTTSQYDYSAMEMVISKMDDDIEGLLNHIGYSTEEITIDYSDPVTSSFDSSDRKDSSDSLFGTYEIDTENAIETTAKTVYKEMQDNQVACKNKYDGKTIKMKGIIDSIGTNVFGQEYVTFETGDPYSIEGVQIFFKNDQMDYVAGLKKGETITIYGVADIGSMTFKMGNCFPAEE